ncbi:MULTISPECIES: enoyl-CoA hydratase-related protein [unclassified Variovorax]|jgi:2-(1,2-epoxy-1,2-dihydrophenyl)acetyl-CoA isomerase|uniref:enoyl-CoA hydratase-related protein n=1 Tax=unclassified Variovorax TaxID=663243 RepID=UPI001781B77A|nr:enoyl-CoA hydratase-related protein [Variovorax sp. VRV01]MBD9663227.1 enoyl-CoA hydratase/isomerase family protein [Variovorax sp. VRV01]
MSELDFDVSQGIATITLNRPDKRNAFDTPMLRAWAAALEESQARDDVRAIVLTGAGQAFCSGGDVGGMKDRSEDTPLDRKNSLTDRVHRIPLTMLAMDKPVLVAVNGAATGAGMDMALMGDIRIAAASARFAESYVKIGIVPGDGGAWFLPRIVGMSRALELLWTGRFVDAQEALRLGIVSEVVPDESLMDHTLALALRIAAGPPIAIRMIKRAARQAQTMDLASHLDQISSHMAVVYATDDHKEAVAAFLEKRAPVFSGK